MRMIIEHSLEFGPQFSRELQKAARGLGVPVGLIRPGRGAGGVQKKRLVRTAKLGIASQMTTKRPPETSGRLGPARARARREVDQDKSGAGEPPAPGPRIGSRSMESLGKGMTMRLTCAGLLTVVMAGGCATPRGPAGPQGMTELHQAEAALRAGQTDRALVHLERAWLVQGDEQPEVVTLLTAEVKLRQGEAADALILAQHALEQDGGNPAAHEVAGKALLKLGRFGDAEQSFLSAQAAYPPDSPEHRQLEDFMNLARGLDAYAAGDPDVAHQYWDGIQSKELRFALDKAVRDQAQYARLPLP